FWNTLWNKYPHSILCAKEDAVGLPPGCMSGSEVGHLSLGSGRIIWQGAAKIEKSIDDGNFFENPILQKTSEHIQKYGSKLHLIGLLSDGGIHSHVNHLLALIQFAKKSGTQKICLHLFLDGRDMAQKSALGLLEKRVLPILDDTVHLSTLCGRATAMDRSENWERTNTTFDLLTKSISLEKLSVSACLEKNYKEGITDEFIQPTRFDENIIEKNDGIVFFNFRSDRMRQLVSLFTGHAPESEQKEVIVPENIFLVSMTEYDQEYKEVWTLFPPEYPKNTLGEWMSVHNLRQFRIAETEKYAHVTYFFNGGREEEYKNEQRMVIPSLGLTNYASNPEMSLPEVVNTLVRVLERQDHEFIVCNFANGDMVGHSGNLEAGIQAVKEVDKALSQVIPVAKANGFTVVITADHGNIEKMKENDEPHTAHTFNDVPLIITDAHVVLPETGYLYQVAPTILKILGLPKPEEMTGESLI
ncbi:MAG: 2,3-bisphosphoglycerate-independent phosphoglycerate mutase, partial [Candidatus Magasanikbacteria bacterium]